MLYQVRSTKTAATCDARTACVDAELKHSSSVSESRPPVKVSPGIALVDESSIKKRQAVTFARRNGKVVTAGQVIQRWFRVKKWYVLSRIFGHGAPHAQPAGCEEMLHARAAAPRTGSHTRCTSRDRASQPTELYHRPFKYQRSGHTAYFDRQGPDRS